MNSRNSPGIDGLVIRVRCDGSQTLLPDPASEVSTGWARLAGISWQSRGRKVTTSQEGDRVRLVLQGVTGDPVEIRWDALARRASLVRQGLWSRPLYFWLGEGELMAADSLRLLVRWLPFRPSLNFYALDVFLALEIIPSPLTPFSSVHKVGVEEVCHIDLTDGRCTRVASPLAERGPTELDAGAESVWEALSEALALRARQCPDPMVLLCSGGLDSTILAHLMRGIGRALVLSYTGTWKDEIQRARRTARNAGLALQAIRLPPFDVAQLEWYASLLDEPLGSTSGFAFSHLCAHLPAGSWIVAGAGACTFSLINENHKRLSLALTAHPGESIAQRFWRQVSFTDEDTRRLLLGEPPSPWAVNPIEDLVLRELPRGENIPRALLAFVRRQLCVEAEMTQLWPIFEAFGHVPVMPFFEPRVAAVLDRMPETVLHDECFGRRLLSRIATLHCPGYVPPPRQLGGGLPLGEPGYPGEKTLREAAASHKRGPLLGGGLETLLDTCAGAEGAERFRLLRRLWAAILLQIWLEQITSGPP
jgi:hypothetical protein